MHSTGFCAFENTAAPYNQSFFSSGMSSSNFAEDCYWVIKSDGIGQVEILIEAFVANSGEGFVKVGIF